LTEKKIRMSFTLGFTRRPHKLQKSRTKYDTSLCSGKEGESARLGRWIYDHFRTFYLNQLPVGAMLINAGSSDDRKAYVLKRGRARPETNYPNLTAKIFPWAEEALAYIKKVQLSLYSGVIEGWKESP
jgi:hypothetical protein